MSVSIALLPVGLTLRLVMGRDNFEQWAQTLQVRIPTTFENKLDLVQTVRRAGYLTEEWGGTLRTHIEDGKQFFYWDCIDGKWTAVFSRSDSADLISKVIADINRAAGREVIGRIQEQASGWIQTVTGAPNPPSIFPTNFRDGELLFRTLKEFGANPIRQGDAIQCKVENTTLIFRQHQDAPFHVEIQNAPDLRKVFEYLSDVDEDYKRCLQSLVYEKLKKRAAEKNLTIESEEVLEDNSIVLTLGIGS
jgi:hypothetical protein